MRLRHEAQLDLCAEVIQFVDDDVAVRDKRADRVNIVETARVQAARRERIEFPHGARGLRLTLRIPHWDDVYQVASVPLQDVIRSHRAGCCAR